jgi:hypothetical protein
LYRCQSLIDDSLQYFYCVFNSKGHDFKPALISGILALSGIVLILYSFMHDINATLHQQIPKPYRYELLVIGDILFVAAFLTAYVKRKGNA